MRKFRARPCVLAVISALWLACSTTAVHAEKPRYILSSGKGWTICETYLKFLKATSANEEPPMCDLKLKRIPGMREPDWEELDISEHFNTVHQIESLLGIWRISPAPEKDFERWKIQREARIKANDERPRLRRTHLALVPDGEVETVLTYDVDTGQCETEVSKARQKLPFDIFLGEPGFFVFDEAKQKVAGSDYWKIRARGHLTLFQGKPYFLKPFIGGMPDFTAGGMWYFRISRFEPIPPTFSFAREFPNDPLYDFHELCLIRADERFP